jgi:hypothetical protein
MDLKIMGMYAEHNRSYMGRHGLDVVKTIIPVVIVLSSMFLTTYDAMMKQARNNWATNRCNPIYMPFAGTIMPQVGQSAGQTTSENFNYCIQKDISAAFGIVLMPFEYANFVMLTTVDLIIQSMIAIMKLYAKLMEWLKSFGLDMNAKIGAFIIPITLAMTKMRDIMARSSAIMLTSLYTTLTLYNIMVSGLLNIANIVLNILIIISATIAGMLAAGALLCAFVITAPVGVPLIAVATLLLLVVFTPTLVIYILLQTFMVDVFGAKARPSPF